MAVSIRLFFRHFSHLPAAIAICIAATCQNAVGQVPGGPERLHQLKPMIFFVAKGAPDSCGTGCNKWIVAEGDIVPDTAAKFREFVEIGTRRDLPVFFHSGGGRAGQAVAVGNILREKKMTAAIGQTIPEGCNVSQFADKDCRRRIEATNEPKARLHQNRGICASACVYAFAGGSERRVHPKARMAVHASSVTRQVRDGVVAYSNPSAELTASSHNALKFQLVSMGIDPALEDLASKIKPDRLHYLNQGEIKNFGLVTTRPFETIWFAHHRDKVGYAIVKSVTRPSRFQPQKYLTIRIQIGCFTGRGSAFLFQIEREYDEQEAGEEVLVRITGGENFAWESKHRPSESSRAKQRVDARSRFTSARELLQLASDKEFEIQEMANNWTSAIRVSTNDLTSALKSAPKECMPSD